jgi:hypothetical protein
MAHGASNMWSAVDQLVDRADSLDDLRAHRMHLLAGRRWRELGQGIPPDLRLEERLSAVTSLAAPALIRRIRDAVEGPLVVLKGPEVAARYPDAVLRPYGDIDLLVPNPEAAQRALLSAGFVPVGDPRLYENIHHARPLALAGVPLPVELHSVPKWPDRFRSPRVDELLEAAVPSSTGVEGVCTLAGAHHAVILAAHSWAHRPLRRLSELIDMSAVSDGHDAAEMRALARRWGLLKIWDTSAAAADALFGEGRTSWPLRTWARHLTEVRDRTVLELHLERWLSAFWDSKVRPAAARLPATLASELLPAPGETVAKKLTRSRRALGNALVPQPRHAEEIEQAGMRAPLFYELNGSEAQPD